MSAFRFGGLIQLMTPWAVMKSKSGSAPRFTSSKSSRRKRMFARSPRAASRLAEAMWSALMSTPTKRARGYAAASVAVVSPCAEPSSQ